MCGCNTAIADVEMFLNCSRSLGRSCVTCTLSEQCRDSCVHGNPRPPAQHAEH
ncbi:hypothetical protein BC628DRAFT_1382438 [Trametes gibbosa]|nr:hypothetical protein BC628DRAFT_1382438 [Trametes gibbosa]